MKAWVDVRRALPEKSLEFRNDWPKPIPTKDAPILIQVWTFIYLFWNKTDLNVMI